MVTPARKAKVLQSDLLSANTGLQAPRRITTLSVAWLFNPSWFKEDYATITLEADLAHLATESDSLDLALISCPEIRDIELDLPKDYARNVALYPLLPEYFLLAIWGPAI